MHNSTFSLFAKIWRHHRVHVQALHFDVLLSNLPFIEYLAIHNPPIDVRISVKKTATYSTHDVKLLLYGSVVIHGEGAAIMH